MLPTNVAKSLSFTMLSQKFTLILTTTLRTSWLRTSTMIAKLLVSTVKKETPTLHLPLTRELGVLAIRSLSRLLTRIIYSESKLVILLNVKVSSFGHLCLPLITLTERTSLTRLHHLHFQKPRMLMKYLTLYKLSLRLNSPMSWLSFSKELFFTTLTLLPTRVCRTCSFLPPLDPIQLVSWTTLTVLITTMVQS